MNTLHLAHWNLSIGKDQELLCFLGLNVLEEESLALEVAKELKLVCADLKLPFIFKASFDKANRSSLESYRGPGMEKGLKILEKVQSHLSIPILSDVHELSQVSRVAELLSVIQIPAFLCRQTDLILHAAAAMEKKKGWLHIKKGQFLSPMDCKNIVRKIEKSYPSYPMTILCERGTSFGYNNLVVDFLAIREMKKLNVPVSMDATHGAQLPGAGVGEAGEKTATGGRRDGVKDLAKAAVAVGVDAIFLEFHPVPDKAKCDAPSCLPLSEAKPLLQTLKNIRNLSRFCKI